MTIFEDPNKGLTGPEKNLMESTFWYMQARDRVENFLSRIDPDLEVDIEESVITPDRKSELPYETVTLLFTHKSNPNIRWTMEIKNDEHYIDHELEGVVKKIYQEQKSEH